MSLYTLEGDAARTVIDLSAIRGLRVRDRTVEILLDGGWCDLREIDEQREGAPQTVAYELYVRIYEAWKEHR